MLLNNFYCNDKAKQTLVNFITDGRLPHTILLEGEDGCGKTTFAKMIAAAVLCQQERANRPCGACRNCRLILSDTHPDVEVVSSENKANAFHIDQSREIRSTAYIRPYDREYKVYILRNIHNMTEQAQNALLKIIEEPPAQVVFIMTCNNRARILQTILSRAAVIPISVCTPQECAKALETLADASVTAEQHIALKEILAKPWSFCGTRKNFSLPAAQDMPQKLSVQDRSLSCFAVYRSIRETKKEKSFCSIFRRFVLTFGS